MCMHVDDEKSQLLNLWQGPTALKDSCYPIRKDRGLLARDAFHRSAEVLHPFETHFSNF